MTMVATKKDYYILQNIIKCLKVLTMINRIKAKPVWLKKSLPKGGDYQRVCNLLSHAGLNTVCKEAACPNMFECFSRDTATFMILGSQCTRNCRFCNVKTGTSFLPMPDPEEPLQVAETALQLKLKYIVVTSVTRDDLEDGGAAHFAATIRAIHKIASDNHGVEVLIPDFQGNTEALTNVINAGPAVLNHNIETVASLYPRVRPEAVYERSLSLLQNSKTIAPLIPVKSGIMVGLGETLSELEKTLNDLVDHDCDILTVGQYLQPTKEHLPVAKYYTPEEFQHIEKLAKKIGFKRVASGPFVRSSYKAEELMVEL
jgi:lipoyl synthase